jgi:hypothetical protein
MQVEYGALVEDKDNKVLGTVDYIVRDTWSGEQRKFMVHRHAPQTDISFTPQHIAQTTEEKVKLNVSLDELERE